MIVTQKYLKTEALELKPFKYSNKTFKLAKTNENKEINIFKQKRSLMPNLVHSLDATSLCLLVDSFCNYLKKNKFENANIFTIHDCFATNYNKMDDLINLLKAVYIKIYTEDSYLKKFDEGILNYIQFIYGKDCYNPVTKILKVSVDTETDVIKLKYPNVDAVISGEITSNDIHTAFGGIN